MKYLYFSKKYAYTYNSNREVTQEDVYYDGSTLSYTNSYAYDNWGNVIYAKNAEGHEQFFSYANTDTSGFFVENTGAIIRTFTNTFSNCTVPSSVHTILLGAAEKQDDTYVREMYITYDSEAHPTQSEDAFGNSTAWLTFSGTFNEETGDISFPIDLTGHTVAGNGVLQITGLPSAEYSYDYWNRLTSETRYISTTAYTVSYQYDVASRLTKLTYPDNMQILYSYDDLDRMTEIKRYVDGSNDEILVDNVQYDVESLLTQFDYGNDLQATFSYDSRDRPSTIDVKDDGTSFLDLDYTYDNSGNITQLINGWRDTNSTWHSDTESYSYDGLDRLTSASCTFWSYTYSYDRAGNRTAKDGVEYTINAVNEVTTLSNGTSFTYDSNGNRTQKTKGADTWVYTYNYAKRLTKVEKNDTTLGEYVYDGDGRRIQVTENSETATYIYSGTNVLYEETATATAAYIYGPKGKLAKRTTNGESHTFFYHTDHLGSTRLVTDENKNIVSAITYHPFGEIDTQEGSEDYLFTGKEKDSTGLYYHGARYYDPEIGKFITRDLLGGQKMAPQTLNRYTYCLNNPLKFIDPDGLKSRYYGGSNPNPVKGTPESYIAGALLVLAGTVIIIGILVTAGVLAVTIPVWVEVLLLISPGIAAIILYKEGVRWMEDVDGDGEFELITEIRNPDGTFDRYVTEEDGTTYMTKYNWQGDIVHQWKIVPDPTNKDNIYIYVWDEETEQWLPDQNQNGIPDEREGTDNSTNDQSSSGSDSEGTSEDNGEGELPEGAM